MGVLRDIPPTAGIPVKTGDLLSLLKPKNGNGSLENDFKRYLGTSYARLTCSGTAALYLILEALKTRFAKRTVVIPSFICPLIPLAIKRAGLNVVVSDINTHNFDYNREGLQELCRTNDDILAIIAVHLAGVPVDIEFIKSVAGKYKILVIEDCAQSLGAEYNGNKVGTLGDISFFSMCRGKGVTTFEGGMIVTNSEEYGALVDSAVERLVKDDFASETMLFLGLLGYWIFYRPALFWFVFKLPQIYWSWRGRRLKAAMEDFDIDFPVHRMSYPRQSIGHAEFTRLDRAIADQRKIASDYIERLEKINGIGVIKESPGHMATYPFLTILFDDPAKRDEALRILDHAGLGASRVYLLSIADYGYLSGIVANRNCENARFMVERTLTLSTSCYMDEASLKHVVSVIRNLCGGA